MRPMNPLGNPGAYHRCSVWRSMASLGFAEKCFGIKVDWRFHRCTDIKCPSCLSKMRTPFGPFWPFLPLSPPGWRGIVVMVRAGGRTGGRVGGRAGGCQTCGTHISVTAWWIFSVRSSMELSRPVVVHCHAHLPICPIWACPWAENLSNLPQIGSRLCGSHISETAGWIYPI